MPDIYINTDRPVDRSIVAGINQPQREAPVGAFVAGSSYDTNLYFVRNDGSFDPASGSVNADVQIAISTISDPVSGSYTLTDGLAITGNIVYGSSAKSVQDALNALNGGTGPNLGSPGLVDVVKNSDTQYTITFRTFGAKTALNGNTVSLYPESTPTGSIAVNGSATEYAQQVIEIVRQPAIYQPNWTEITNGFNATIALNTTRLLQSLVVDQGQPFFIEVKLDGETVAREVIGMELSTMPASAFSGVVIQSLLDQFAANPLSNSYFDSASWVAALGDNFVTSVNGQVGDVLVATVEQGALADTAVQPASTDTLTNKTIADISNNVHADLLHLHVRANEAISKGQAVKFDSYNQGQGSIEVSLADQATDISIGLAQGDIALNQLGLVATSGVLEDVDTSAYTEGAILYVNGSGDLQETEPTTGFSQPIALCLRSNQNNGVLDILADYPKQPASDVRNDSTVTGATVKDALEYLETNLGVQTWGGITGTLSNQTDLQNALDAKQNILAEGAFIDGDKTKLDGISPGAQVNDPTTLLDSDIGTTVQAHSTVLDATTANFTTAAALKLNDIEAGATKGGTAQDDSTLAIKPRLDTKSGSVAGGARGLDAIDLQVARNASTQVASGTRSMILAGTNNTASSSGATVIAANSSNATGNGSVIIGGSSNNSSGSNDEILGSQNSSTSGTGSTIVGGSGCSNSGNWGIVLGGLNHQITQPRGSVIGGSGNIVNHVNSAVIGCTNTTTDAGDTVFVPSLNVGAGYKMPTGAGDGYVLTTDANGVGTWQEPASVSGGVQSKATASGVLTIDYSLGANVKTTLTESVTSIAITNAVEGDSGLIIFDTDGLATYSMTVGLANKVLSGYPVDFQSLTANDIITMGYYYNGSGLYLYISQIG